MSNLQDQIYDCTKRSPFARGLTPKPTEPGKWVIMGKVVVPLRTHNIKDR